MADDKKTEALKNLDLDKLHSDTLQKIEEAGDDDVEKASERFNATLDEYDRYLDAKQKELRQKKVKVKDIVADEDAVQDVLKTFHAINAKIQQQIADGTELSRNDITLLTSMMSILNGGD